MKCACGCDVTGWLAGRATDAVSFAYRPVVIGLAGYPFMGKSALAAALLRQWTAGSAVIVPTETAIVARQARRSSMLDGSSAAAHDLHYLDDIVARLLGGTGVTVPVYSWDAGRHTAMARLPGLDNGDLLVVDGSVACEEPLASRCDVLAFLRPRDAQSWIRHAVARDVHDRAWRRDEALVQNLRKQSTVDRQRRQVDHLITDIVTVQPDDWTASIEGCQQCLQQSGTHCG